MNDPRRKIIDAHHHLWDLEAVHYPWLMAKGVKRFFGDPTPIQKNYLPADLRADAGNYELLGSIHIQVGSAEGDELKETDFVQHCADNTGLPSAIVAFVDLAKENAQEMLAEQQKRSKVRGIRQIVGRSAEEDSRTGSDALLDDPVWRENLAILASLDLSFDLQMIPSQMPKVIDVLSTMPGLRVALCHCGSPWDQTSAGFRSWRAGLEEFATLPNTCCKISGLGMFNHDWNVEDIRPIVESCIEVFGPSRAMFASNFPVDSLHGSYRKVWGAFEEIAGQYGDEERDDLFVETARQFYGL